LFRRAQLDFGRIEQTKEKCRDTRRVNWLQDLIQDLRYGLRMLRKSPAFTAAVVLTLALGIGANTAVFSVMNTVLLRALPVSHPDQLLYMILANDQPSGASNTGNGDTSFSEPVFEQLRKEHHVFSDLMAFVPPSESKVAVRIGQDPEETEGDEVSGNFFSGLGVSFARGRGFSLEDEAAHASVAVLSYGYWTGRFGRNPSVLLAFAGGRLMRSMLFGLGPADSLSFSLALLGVTFVALVAGLIPARRAMRVDPMVALRYE